MFPEVKPESPRQAKKKLLTDIRPDQVVSENNLLVKPEQRPVVQETVVKRKPLAVLKDTLKKNMDDEHVKNLLSKLDGNLIFKSCSHFQRKEVFQFLL
jgi:hypothetical protein